MAWFQDSFVLDPTDRRVMEARGTKYTLTIKNVQSSDFGNYSCQGENNLGKTRKFMELSGTMLGVYLSLKNKAGVLYRHCEIRTLKHYLFCLH